MTNNKPPICGEVDVYDFDKTVIPFDSGSLFWAYCLLHNPWIVVAMPYQLIASVPFLVGIKDLTFAKKSFFSFVRLIDLDKNVKGFWNRYEKQVFEWFKKPNRARPAVIISASPDFLLNEIAKRLEVEHLICTKHIAKSGAIIGRNCRGDEKVSRFNSEKGDCKVVCVYSDSVKHDRPIFSLGEKCFHTVKGERIEFSYAEVYKNK